MALAAAAAIAATAYNVCLCALYAFRPQCKCIKLTYPLSVAVNDTQSNSIEFQSGISRDNIFDELGLNSIRIIDGIWHRMVFGNVIEQFLVCGILPILHTNGNRRIVK